jgi:hypothetical protein
MTAIELAIGVVWLAPVAVIWAAVLKGEVELALQSDRLTAKQREEREAGAFVALFAPTWPVFAIVFTLDKFGLHPGPPL